jgi:hypothetical protein
MTARSLETSELKKKYITDFDKIWYSWLYTKRCFCVPFEDYTLRRRKMNGEL